MSAVNGPAQGFDAVRASASSGQAPSVSVPYPALRGSEWHAIVVGTLVAGVLDAVDGVVAFYLAAGMNPVQVLQYIASGALGASSFQGGLPTAALGAVLHFFIAFVAAGLYVLASRRVAALKAYPFVFGSTYGVAVYVFMNFVVLPLSAVPKSGMSLGLLLNGVIGHAVFVGLPIALAARRVAPERGRR